MLSNESRILSRNFARFSLRRCFISSTEEIASAVLL